MGQKEGQKQKVTKGNRLNLASSIVLYKAVADTSGRACGLGEVFEYLIYRGGFHHSEDDDTENP